MFTTGSKVRLWGHNWTPLCDCTRTSSDSSKTLETVFFVASPPPPPHSPLTHAVLPLCMVFSNTCSILFFNRLWFDRQTSLCLFITIKAICINAILLSQSMYNVCHLPAGSLFSHVTTCDLAAIASHIACRFVQIASSIAGPARGSINDSDGYHSTRRFGVSRVNKISWSR